MTGIYSIINNQNQKRYIGQSVEIEERIKRHFRELRKGIHHNKHLQSSFDKYGEDVFSFEILEECEEEELNSKEVQWIKQFDSYNSGYNETIGGDGVRGWKANDEFKEKIRKLVTGSNNPNYGNHWSDEQKEKASKRIKESGIYKCENNPRATKIICIETMEIFDYIELAAKKYNYRSASSISIALKDPSRVAGQYHFAYYSDEFYDYLKNNQFNYLCNCYAKSKSGIYYADLTNHKILQKTEIFHIVYKNTDMTTRETREFIKNSNFEINNVQYELLNSRLTQ